MRLISGFTVRNILGETIAVPSQEAARQLSGLASLNETGGFLFHLLETEQTEDTLITAMTDKYDVDDQTAAADVQSFLQILRENHLLIE